MTPLFQLVNNVPYLSLSFCPWPFLTVFETPADYLAFENILKEAHDRKVCVSPKRRRAIGGHALGKIEEGKEQRDGEKRRDVVDYLE